MAQAATAKKEHLGLSAIKGEAPRQLQNTGNALLKLDINQIRLTDQASHDKAVSILQRIKQFRKEWAEYWDSDIAAAHGLHKSLCEKKNQLDRPAERLEKALASNIGSFLAQIEAKEAQAKAEAQERARIAAEAQRKAEIKEAKASGAPKPVLEAMKQEPLSVAKADAPEIIERAAGTSTPKRWKMQVVSKLALLKYCAEHPEYAYLFDYNEGEGNRLAQRQKEILQANPLPGTMVTCESGFRARTF